MQKRRYRKKSNIRKIMFLVTIISFFTIILIVLKEEPEPAPAVFNITKPYTFEEELVDFAYRNNLSQNDWPDYLLELVNKNPETKEFVLNYPLEKDKEHEIDLSEYKNCSSVPLLMQWDERWGYKEYAGELMGISGCGPTCLSMVAIYLLNDATLTPEYIANFSTESGYSLDGNGSSWTLISDGGEKLGINVEEIPLMESFITSNLEEGNPIICVMGEGDFTSTGHFIVMTDYVDGKIKVNDPNSKERSLKNWEYDNIKDQIRNLWVCTS